MTGREADLLVHVPITVHSAPHILLAFLPNHEPWRYALWLGMMYGSAVKPFRIGCVLLTNWSDPELEMCCEGVLQTGISTDTALKAD